MPAIIYKVTAKLDGTDIKLTEISTVQQPEQEAANRKGGRSRRNRKNVNRKRNTKRKSM